MFDYSARQRVPGDSSVGEPFTKYGGRLSDIINSTACEYEYSVSGDITKVVGEFILRYEYLAVSRCR